MVCYHQRMLEAGPIATKQYYIRTQTQRMDTDLIIVKRYLRWFKRLESLIYITSSDLILDLGCGAGYLLIPLCGHKANINALDISAPNLRTAKTFIKLRGEIPKPNFIQGEATNLPFSDEVFTKVFAFAILEHLEEPGKALSEIYRVLKGGGTLAILQSYRLDEYQKLWHRLLWRLHLVNKPTSSIEFKHINQLDPHGWSQLLRKKGFKILAVKATSIIPPLHYAFSFLSGYLYHIPVIQNLDWKLCQNYAIANKLALINIFISKK